MKQPTLYRHMLGWILLLLMAACSQSEEELPAPGGTGSLTLTIASTPESRATTPGDGDLYGGGGMEDLTLVLVNPVGNISEISRLTGLAGGEQQIKTVTFSNLDVGNYTIYAYANTERAQLNEARTLLATLAPGDRFDAAMRDALFTTLSGTTTPQIHGTEPLLLTAKKEVEIQIGNSSEQIELLRPVVWFEVRLFNHSEHPMQITALSFSVFNPSTGYLFPHDGAIPSSVNYRALPSLADYTGGATLTVAAATEQTIYETALFENRAPSYTMSLTTQVGSSSLIDMTAISSTSEHYLLCNRSTGNYLIDNGSGRLSVVDTPSDAPTEEHARWRFSNTRSGYLINVATGNRFYRSTTASTSGSSLTFGFYSGYLRLSYSSGRSTYYLRDNDGSVSFTTSSNNQRDWRLQQAQQQTASLTNSPIQVVDATTAAVTPMREQLRNQHIRILINAYYNDTEGTFNFRVPPWQEREEEVEFN